ncbi:uncharacterized protein CMU_002810 [Cryptosporidium muris RN66]|uniref:Uncharacterized protein n=1 Tax=Cryptosporidium muris (strain RN66) TaxID=441375 RepID=B6AJR0_CRYMR|nr:uncharacterized protein CMU_002810 [Cryptosporidium muris RN66]EEA08451.1 hypothetical protein, conserved [Cryptosporidium muris RN66]|eukprot:XP_002142800.1 hypothetical protein [Cryptosporidium muris RN66]
MKNLDSTPYNSGEDTTLLPEIPYEQAKFEIKSIESELKDWFLTRRFNMERNLAIKILLDHHNYTGISINNPNLPPKYKILWDNLVNKKPELEDSLSNAAKQKIVDIYLDIFRNSTKIDHPCRIPGGLYLRCLKSNSNMLRHNREKLCIELFNSFNTCRDKIKQENQNNLRYLKLKQDISDNRAKVSL